ncbi:MAG: AI-2E family transporter [Herpetosiphonaceae bacterium]|nr:AI-2E family transporter [Herpetosiphonaceae bacterium]
MNAETTVRVSARTVILTLVVLAGVWLTLLLYRVFVLLFVAILLAVAISSAVDRLERWRIPRLVSILVMYVLIIVLLVGMGFVLVPLVVQQVGLLSQQLPNLVRQPLLRGSQLVSERFPELAPNLRIGELAQQVAQYIATLVSDVGGAAISFGRAMVGFIINLIVVLVLAFFLISRRGVASSFITRVVPLRHQDRLITVTNVIGRRLGRWVRAQFVIATFYAVCFGFGLQVLGVPYAIALGVIGGILELVPYVGGFMATILTMIVAFTKEPSLALWVLALHLVVGNIEVHVIAPKVMGHAVETHPVIAIMALFSGIELLGIIGGLIAIPLAVVGQALVEEFWIKRIAVHDSAPLPPLTIPARRPAIQRRLGRRPANRRSIH